MKTLKKQDKLSEKELSKVEINILANEEFKVVIPERLIELKRRMDEHSENFKRVRKYREDSNRTEE